MSLNGSREVVYGSYEGKLSKKYAALTISDKSECFRLIGAFDGEVENDFFVGNCLSVFALEGQLVVGVFCFFEVRLLDSTFFCLLL